MAVAVIAAVLLLPAGGVTAQDYANYVGLFCDVDSNRALIRFGYKDHNGAIEFPAAPVGVDPLLATQALQPGKACVLANGWEVKVKHGVDRIYPFGRCGAAPPEWFSLWIDRRKLLSREYFMTDCHDGPYLSHVVIDAVAIEKCEYADQQQYIRSRQTPAAAICERASLSLGRLAVDTAEYPRPGVKRPAVGTMLITRATDEAFCRSLVTTGRKGSGLPDLWGRDDPEWDGFSTTDETISFRSLREPQPRFDVRLQGVYPGVERAIFDFDNDGTDDVVYRVSGESRPFWGSYFIVARSDLGDVEDLDRIVAAHAKEATSDGPVAGGGGWQTYDSRHTPYESDNVEMHTIRANSTTYVLAHSSYGKQPTAVLYRPSPAGQLEQVCSYELVEDNF